MKKVMSLTYASSLSDMCEVNSSFDTGVLKICYTGQNRNGSDISKAAIKRSLNTLYNCPVVCNYDRETDTLGGHDMEVVQSDDGLRLVNMTQPVGVIPESAKVWFDECEEEDGTVHEYLFSEVLLWKRQEAYKKLKKDGITAHSMELNVKDGESVDGIYHIKDFEFTAFCLIGVEPCFEGSALELFSMNSFKEQFSQMMQELKENYESVNAADAVDDKSQILTEGGEEVLEQKMELVDEEVVVEEQEEKFEKAEDAESAEEATEVEVAAEEPVAEEPAEEPATAEEFALNSNLVEELARSVEAVTIQKEWGECHKYWFIDCDMDAAKVYCWDTEDWLLYGFDYEMNGDAVVVNFESKKRMKYAIVEFDEGEQASPIAQVFAHFEQKIIDNAGWESKYQTASATIDSMNAEMESLRDFKMQVENAESEKAMDAVFAKFGDLEEIDAFKQLKENRKNYDIESLEEKCYAIRGRNGTAAKFELQETAPKIPVVKTGATTGDEPYNGLFVRYGFAR